MLFNSWTFLVFIILVLALYYNLSFRWQNRMLLAASCLFYSAWDWRFLILLVVSASIDFSVGLKIHQTQSSGARKWLLLLSCGANLGILGFFKYCNFFRANAALALAWFGLSASSATLDIILPLGISFYTFHSLSYTIDVYRGKMVPIRSFPDYMLFVMYFPQLVAGPIARAVALIPQVVSPRAVTRSAVIEGLWLTLWGLFKKMVIADNLAPLVDATFELEQAPSGGQCLLTLYAFAFQIYCDFSGYTDIARGLARLMGFQLALNFALPYTACNPVEFWQRWHISLSTWFRDYLYIPLGGNRHGLWKTCRNLLLTMLLGGLWHGAAWNFIIWGLYHGVLLVLYRLWATLRPAPVSNASRRAGGLVSGVIMFHFTCLGWLFFRATSVEQIQNFLEQIFTNFSFNRDAATMVFPVVFFSGILWIFELWLRNNDDPRLRPGWNRGLGPLTVFVLILSIMFLAAGKWQQFIYFQF